jgi:ribonuclease HII
MDKTCRPQPMTKFEQQAKALGFSLVIGIDEAGRGPLAGPVVAGAVALKVCSFNTPIRDSKTLSVQQRERAFEEIHANAYVGVGVISETVIDADNISEATFHAMTNAVLHLIRQLPASCRKPNLLLKNICLLVDGNRFKTDLPYQYKTIIKGDSLSLSVACASIVAKVTRDRMLNVYDKIFPHYGFREHKGYPTIKHREAISKFGLSPIHRQSFRCVA